MEDIIVRGIVENLKDDQSGARRVIVKFPHLNDEVSDWLRVASPMAGKGRGLFLRPEKGDEVLVAHLQGSRKEAYVIGALWSDADQPPADDGKQEANNWRFFRSRAGHTLKFDDTQGKERIEIVGSGDKHKLVIDVSGSRIEISCSSGDISLSAPSGKVSIEASSAEIKTKQNLTLDASGTLTIKGQLVTINP